MNKNSPPNPSTDTPEVHVHLHPPKHRWWIRLLVLALVVSIVLNFTQLAQYRSYSEAAAAHERFVDGDFSSDNKIALLEIFGTIMSPMSEDIIATIEQIGEDDDVKGVVVVIDSPGGFVADSHRIYAHLRELREKKPMVVSMGRIAASGGYYAAMGAGPDATIFAEQTTWTGSIGVIIPRYDLSELGQQYGVKSDPIATGAMKNSLDPFSELTEKEREVWDEIIGQAYDEFVGVIDSGRSELDDATIRKLADGRIYTANQALEHHLIDQIGDRDDAIEHLKQQLQLSEARIVRYQRPMSLTRTLIGIQAQAQPTDPVKLLLDHNTPQAMYYFGW